MADLGSSEPQVPIPKRPYRGPKPDEATFASQQEFLDSLTPIPLSSVDENDRKCAHCWRQYGESNPGQDDAEAPVRFKCNHVFGEQCMRSLYAVKEPLRVDLVPLSFAPGSKGANLGSRLRQYVSRPSILITTSIDKQRSQRVLPRRITLIWPKTTP